MSFRFRELVTPRAGVRALFDLMSRQHGLATTGQSRHLGISRRVERRRLADGTLWAPFPGVLAAGGAPMSFEGRALAAAWSPGVVAVSHSAAARLHGLDGFCGRGGVTDDAPIDVIGRHGARLHHSVGARTHSTRGAIDEHVTTIGPIPVLTVAATLALLAPEVGIGPTARALDSALRMGVSTDELRRVAAAWRIRGRSGPAILLQLLDAQAMRATSGQFPSVRDAATVTAQAGLARPSRASGVFGANEAINAVTAHLSHRQLGA